MDVDVVAAAADGLHTDGMFLEVIENEGLDVHFESVLQVAQRSLHQSALGSHAQSALHCRVAWCQINVIVVK